MLTSLLTLFGKGCEKSFFGLQPWYHYLDFDSKTCEINNFQILPVGGKSSDIPLVFLVIADDLLRIAGVVAVAFVIVGAVQFVTSQGSPEQAAKARTTVINALVGLAIALTSIALVSFIGSKVGV